MMVECRREKVESCEQELSADAEAGRLPNVIWNERECRCVGIVVTPRESLVGLAQDLYLRPRKVVPWKGRASRG